MNRDWKRLGDAIKARREELGMTTQQALADAAGVTRQTVQSLESGKPRKRTPKALNAVAKALGWGPDTVAGYLAVTPSVQSGASPRLAEGMPVRVVQELSSGEAVDTEVVELSVPGSPFKLVAIFKQDAEAASAAPEEMAQALEKWSRMQRALREIADDQT
ncbi:helix-turn-helix transcriptional regulator [Streptomyces adelaidensis]|uniref:helix-turn-helix transcriptional regulator n=1 Tax=Streptomyces adelaidensis TaxID=2796465 RepID=UPI0019071339|nr:helix-turn-helix domain-containing protein [Streptomyces adelaidensis]